MDTLVLNKNWQPDRVINWKTAMTLICSQRVEVVEYHNSSIIRTPTTTFKVPSVIRYLTGKAAKFNIKLSRRMLFYRDQGKCQYCSKEVSIHKFTVDHVLPKSKNGKTNWRNVVVSCNTCNSKKRDRTPEEAGMSLLKEPQRPESKLELLRQELKEINKWNNYV